MGSRLAKHRLYKAAGGFSCCGGIQVVRHCAVEVPDADGDAQLGEADHVAGMQVDEGSDGASLVCARDG